MEMTVTAAIAIDSDGCPPIVLSGAEQAREVEHALEGLRPAMEADGGGVDLVSVDGGIVSVRLKGTCLGCPSASLTMRVGIEGTLRSRLTWVRSVVRVP